MAHQSMIGAYHRILLRWTADHIWTRIPLQPFIADQLRTAPASTLISGNDLLIYGSIDLHYPPKQKGALYDYEAISRAAEAQSELPRHQEQLR